MSSCVMSSSSIMLHGSKCSEHEHESISISISITHKNESIIRTWDYIFSFYKYSFICKNNFFVFCVKLFTWFMWCISSNNLSLAVRITSTSLSIRWGWGWDFKMLSQELLSHILILLAWKLSWTRKYNTWKWKCHTYTR